MFGFARTEAKTAGEMEVEDAEYSFEQGEKFYREGNYPKAIERLEKCYTVYHANEFCLAKAVQTAYYLGQGYIQQGNYLSACNYLEYVYRNLAIVEPPVDSLFFARAIRALGYCYQSLGLFVSAIAPLQQAVSGFYNLSIHDGTHYKSVAWSALQLAQCFLEEGIYGDAIIYLLFAESIFKELKNSIGLAEVNFELGRYYNFKEKTSAAAVRLERAYHTYKSLKDEGKDEAAEINMADAAQHLGLCWYRQKQFEKAINYLEETVAVYSHHQNKTEQRMSSLLGLGLCRYLSADSKAAEECFSSVLVFFKGIEHSLANEKVAFKVIHLWLKELQPMLIGSPGLRQILNFYQNWKSRAVSIVSGNAGHFYQRAVDFFIDKRVLADHLHFAVTHGKLREVELLFGSTAEEKLAIAHYQEKSGDNLLHWTALISTHHTPAAMVNFLVTQGASLNVPGSRAESSLCRAARFGNVRVVEALLKAKAPVDMPDQDSRTPLATVCEEGEVCQTAEELAIYDEIASLLLQAGADKTRALPMYKGDLLRWSLDIGFKKTAGVIKEQHSLQVAKKSGFVCFSLTTWWYQQQRHRDQKCESTPFVSHILSFLAPPLPVDMNNKKPRDTLGRAVAKMFKH